VADSTYISASLHASSAPAPAPDGAVVAFLCSADAGYVTSGIYTVDGGSMGLSRGSGPGYEPRSPTPGFSATGTGRASAAPVSSVCSTGITSRAKKRRLRSASSYGMPA
jgi:hypothetical protein